MTIIYTEDGLLEIQFTYERLKEMCNEPQGEVPIRFLPFGHHNKDWIENRRLWDQLWRDFVTSLSEEKSALSLLGSSPRKFNAIPKLLEVKVAATLGARFHSCPNVPGPVHQTDLTAENWIGWVMWRLMKFGDEPDYEQIYREVEDDSSVIAAVVREHNEPLCRFTILIEAKHWHAEDLIDELKHRRQVKYVELVSKEPVREVSNGL